MFGSHARAGGGNGNPFGSSAGPAMATNPFQGGKQNNAAPVFGSGGFQPPLPPGGMAGAPAIAVPRKKQQATTFGGASAAANPFAVGEGAPSQTAFGGGGGNNRTSFGGNNDRAHGPARNGGGSRNKTATTFGGTPSGSTTFGQPQTSFGGSGGFHPPANSANEYSFGSKGGRRNSDGPVSQVNTSFGGGFGAGPKGPAATPPGATTFGNRTLRPKMKQITPSAADGGAGENPFAPRPASGGKGNRQSAPFGGGAIHEDAGTTTFGSAGPKGAGATAFGGGFPQSDGFGALEARMNGGAKTAFGKPKHMQLGNRAGGDATQGKPKALTRNRSPAASGNGFGAPMPSPEQSPTAMQMKHKKKPMRSPPPSMSDNDEAPQSFSANPSDGADKKAELASAVNLDGTCVDMCSPKERELHIRVDELSVFEKCFPGQPGFERELIIKRFQRSSADHKLNIPSEIRPPGVLRQTQLYIEQEIMDRERLGPDPRFSTPRAPEIIELYNFCWDRFRMIRKDFVLQNYRGAGGRVHPIVLDVHERIARYHVLSEHELCEVPSFVAQQNMEQLGQTLKSLNELYDESRKLGDPAYWSPFEAEFRAYFILCTLDNGRGLDVLKFVKGLSRSILESDMVKFAMRVFVSRHTNDYFQFFKLLREATYLQACLLFRYIPGVRSSALQRMNRGFRNQPYPLLDLVELLCFDDQEHAESVCRQHGLEISPMTDGQTEILAVHFGGEFLSENQLRRDKTPLEVHSSHVYVGQKQGDYLRRDVCRGVTEYAPEEYPALSKLIQDTESQERARLYPDRPPYEDKYSYFVSFTDSNPHLSGSSATQDFQDNVHHSNGIDQHHQLSELEVIAKRKADLEQKQKLALQRIEQLKREKEERIMLERKEKEAADAKARQETAAKAKAQEDLQAQARERELAETLKRQRELENRLREEQRQQMLQKQREVEEEKRRIEEARQAAIRTKEAELRRIEQERIAEQEAKKRQETLRLQEEADRLAAEARERQRQKELAEERIRLQRQAELEAKRREQVEKERIQRKIALRIQKQKRAVMKLRFHMWKKYLVESRDTRRPVKIDSSFFGSQIQERPANVVDWLFDGKRSASSLVGIRRRKQSEPAITSDQVPSTRFVAELWRPLDLASLAGPRLLKQNMNVPTIAWKLVIADLVDGSASGFGHWCAAKTGIEGMSSSPASLDSQSEYHSVFHYHHDSPPQIAGICCRYVDASIVKDVYATRQQITGVSAIIFPVVLSELQDQGKRARWQQRIEKLRQALSPDCRVALFVLALGSNPALAANVSENRESDVHQYVEHELRLTFTNAVISLDSSLLVNGVDTTKADICGNKFKQMVLSLTRRASPSTNHIRRFDLKDLLEDALGLALRLPVPPEALPKQIQSLFARIRSEVVEKAQWKDEQSAPELQDVLPESLSLHSMRTEVVSVLSSLESVQLVPEASGPLDKLQVCDVFFQHMSRVIDLIFQCLRETSSVSTLEVKKQLYNSLLSIHEQLQSKKTPAFDSVQDAASVFTWQKILELVYGSFLEALDGVAVFMPSDWDPSTLVPNAKPVKAPATTLTTKSSAVVSEPVPVSASSVKRSFGVALASEAPKADEPAAMASYLMVPKDRAADRAVKKLRQQIAHDKQVSSSYQRMLQRELMRWSISPP